jgi:hypothetical protein
VDKEYLQYVYKYQDFKGLGLKLLEKLFLKNEFFQRNITCQQL